MIGKVDIKDALWRFIPYLITFLAALNCPAHEGPPYPILIDRKTIPFLVSVWADPDLGKGTFLITFVPENPHNAVNPSLLPVPVVRMSFRPLVPGFPPKTFTAHLKESRDNFLLFNVEVPFDRLGYWETDVSWSTQKHSEKISSVIFEVTPPGPPLWQLFLFLTPFLAIGAIWGKRMLAA